ncbi:MAG: hypothetical protein GY722_24775 [bacterium]|nr:hypothetical protein [bacterium]
MHEQFHIIDQWNRHRLTEPRYLLESAIQWWRGNDPYRDNRFEKEARVFAEANEAKVWNYDKIGNRLSETRDGATAFEDSFFVRWPELPQRVDTYSVSWWRD